MDAFGFLSDGAILAAIFYLVTKLEVFVAPVRLETGQISMACRKAMDRINRILALPHAFMTYL